MKRFKEAIQTKEFCFAADLSLSNMKDPEALLTEATLLTQAVDAVMVSDNSLGIPQISALAAASLLIQQGIDPILQLSGRDRNINALEGDLRGAIALGVTSFLMTRGKSTEAQTGAQARVSATKLIQLAMKLKESTDNQDIFLGAIAKVFKPKEDWLPESLGTKIKAGAQFVQCQLCFNIEALKAYMQSLIKSRITWEAPIVISLGVLQSAENARWLKDNFKGSLIPQAVIQRMQQASNPVNEGIRISAELIQQFAEIPGVSGVCMMSQGNPESIVEVIKASGIAQATEDS